MKYTLFLSVIIGTIFFVSCKKDVTDLQTEKPEIIDKTKSFIKDVKSDTLSEYYISGEFDDHKIYCSSTFASTFPYHDTVFNALYVNNNIDLDNIHLIRENNEMSVMIAIYFDKAKIFTRQFPYDLPRANLDICEAAQMELINMKKLGTTGQGSPTDDFSFWGHTNSSIKVQVTSFVDNIMEGTFEGTLTTKTGSTIIAKNGKFRIKIIIVNTGNG
jgi:hypothetical protein